MIPEQFLADFPAHIQALAHELRAVVKRAVPIRAGACWVTR